MQRYTIEQRRQHADQLCALIREWIVGQENDFAIDVRRGVDWCPDVRTRDPIPRANPTFTLTLRINGGARDGEGPPILPAPRVFREPPG